MKTFARAQSSGVPLKELSRVKLRRLTREHISKKLVIKPVELMFFVSLVTHSVNVHVNTRAKGNPIKAVREGRSIILRFERSKIGRVPKVIERPGVFRDRNRRIN